MRVTLLTVPDPQTREAILRRIAELEASRKDGSDFIGLSHEESEELARLIKALYELPAEPR